MSVDFLHHPSRTDAEHSVLFLHGMGNSASVWDTCVPHLPDNVEAWAAELPWRGGADPTWGQDRDIEAWTGRVIDALPGRVDVLVAHSFATSLVLEHLSQALASGTDPLAEAGIRGLVLAAPFYRRNTSDFSWDVIVNAGPESQATIGEGLRLHSGGRLSPRVQEHLSRRVCELVGPYAWLRFLDLYLRTPWLRTDLLTTPCLVVTGPTDAVHADAVALAASLPAATLATLPGCGHFPMLAEPAEFGSVIADFLTVPTRRSPIDA